jgi:hypothetical protein
MSYVGIIASLTTNEERKMNITELMFQYSIEIVHEGDYDGGSYDMTIEYETSTQQGTGIVKTTVELKQDDINEMYKGALKLVNSLKKHIYEGY